MCFQRAEKVETEKRIDLFHSRHFDWAGNAQVQSIMLMMALFQRLRERLLIDI